jgi:hypothetical protein
MPGRATVATGRPSRLKTRTCEEASLRYRPTIRPPTALVSSSVSPDSGTISFQFSRDGERVSMAITRRRAAWRLVWNRNTGPRLSTKVYSASKSSSNGTTGASGLVKSR